MNKLVEILDIVSSIRSDLGGDAFNSVPNLEYEALSEKLGEIEDIVLSTRDDGEFEDIDGEFEDGDD